MHKPKAIGPRVRTAGMRTEAIFWIAFFLAVFAAGFLNQVGKGPHLLMPANRETFYGGTEQGYTDYPILRVVEPHACYEHHLEAAWG
jgi:hypothetical protein